MLHLPVSQSHRGRNRVGLKTPTNDDDDTRTELYREGSAHLIRHEIRLQEILEESFHRPLSETTVARPSGSGLPGGFGDAGAGSGAGYYRRVYGEFV